MNKFSIKSIITGRNQAEAELWESEARYRALFNGSADGIVIADSETKQFKYANPALCRMLGYSEAELTTLGVADVHPKESLPHVVSEFEAQARGDKTLAADIPCLRKDGSIFPADISATKITIAGRPCNVGFFRDITRRKQAEAVSTRLAAIVEFSDDAIIGKDLNGIITSWNRGAEKLFGYASGEMLGSSIMRLIPADKQDEERQILEKIKRGESMEPFETLRQARDGRLIDVSIMASPIKDATGQVIGVSKVARDITRRKQTENALRMFQFASDKAADTIFWLDQNAGFYYVNDEACRSLGYSREELMRLSLFDIDPFFPREKWEENWKRFRDRQIETIRLESRHRRKDGSIFPVEVMVKYSCFGGTELHLIFARDMTEHKRVAEALHTAFNQQKLIGDILRVSLENVPLEQMLAKALDLVLAMPELALQRKGAIFLVEPGTETLVMRTQRGLAEHLLASCARVQFGKCLCGRAAASGQMEFCDHVDEHHVTRYEGMMPHGHYCVPMQSAGGTVGVICLYVEQGHRRDERMEQILAAVANALTGVIERKRAEEALRMFQFASDHAADAVFWLDENAGFCYVNNEACRALGYTREELMRLSLFDISPSVSREKWAENWKRFRDQQIETLRLESRHRRKDGSVFPVEVTAKHLRFGDTDLHVDFARDITERKQAENALRMFQLASDNAADEIFWVDQNAGFYYVNDAACRSLGYTREELMRLNLFDIDPFISREQLEAKWKQSRDEKLDALRMESRHRRKDGSSFPIEVIAKHFDFDGTDLTLAFVRDMTEHKRTEADLTYERNLFRTLLDTSMDEIYFKDAKSRFIKASKAMARQFGVASAEEMVGKTDFDFFTEEHARPAFEDEQEVIRTGVPIIGKVEKEVWQDGRETWCLTTKMPFRGKDGKIIGTFGVSKDITALKKIEHELAYERDLFETLMNQSPDSIYFKDLQSRFVLFSRSKVKKGFADELARHNAAHPDEKEENRPAHLASEERFAEYLVGKTDFDLFAEAHARPAFEDEQEIIRTGVPLVGKVEKEVWLDGRVTWVLTNKMPFRDKDGKIIGTFGVSKDITAMKQAEEQLRQLSRAVEQSPACIVITDPAGNITYVNPKFIAITGYTFEEALGKNPRILKSGETPPSDYAKLWQTITSGKEWRGQFHNKKKNGELYWESASLSPIFDADGKIIRFLAVKEDITARKQAEAERERLIQELQRALASVKSLSGLLPICAGCKKIRDDKGYWSQVESYIQQHSEAKFSHGMCPDCIKKFFPGLEKNDPVNPPKETA